MTPAEGSEQVRFLGVAHQLEQASDRVEHAIGRAPDVHTRMLAGSYWSTSRPSMTTFAPWATMQSAGPIVDWLGLDVACDNRAANVPGRRSGKTPSCGAAAARRFAMRRSAIVPGPLSVVSAEATADLVGPPAAGVLLIGAS